MSAIVDENSNSDAPNAKYVLKKGDNVIWTYDNSVRAKEWYEAAKALVWTPVAEEVEVVEEPEVVEETTEEPVEEPTEEVVEEPVEETVEEDLPSNE
jgi:outer membrane biosynthesis protein TonB